LENKADIKGGSVFARKENFSIERVLFSRSQARYGGALYFAEVQNIASAGRIIRINDVSFDLNTAHDFGAERILFIPLSVINEEFYGFYGQITSLNNTDPKNLTIFDGKIASFGFSFYNISSEKSDINDINDNDDNLREWIKNKTKTVNIL